MTERNSLFNIIADMENDVRDIGRWAEMISLLGSSPHMVKPDVLYALSKPLAQLSEPIEAEWQKASALAAGRNAR